MDSGIVGGVLGYKNVGVRPSYALWSAALGIAIRRSPL